MVLSTAQQELKAAAHELAANQIKGQAGRIDSERRYPSENLSALGKAGLLGILVPQAYGGRGGSLTDLVVVEEEIGWACASTAMCALMHSCGTAVIAAKASAAQAENWLRPAASGDKLATLAFSERGTGAHFYQPELNAVIRNGGFVISGTKSFVTNGGHADLYPILVNASSAAALDILVLTPELPGITFQGEWDGVGMAGNSSINMVLSDVVVSRDHLIGAEGDGQELVFNVVAPTFLLGLAAVNVGIAQSALDESIERAQTRHYPNGQTLAEVPIIQNYIADMSIATESARQLVLAAAAAADSGEPTALLMVMAAKIKATEAAQAVTNTAMQVGGGQAYSRQLPLERHWRDARAGSIMAPTNEVLREWLGKSLTGLPLF